MYPGTAELSQAHATCGQQEALLAPASGIFLPDAGRRFPDADEEGRPHRPHRLRSSATTLAELVAPADGMFFGLRALPNVKTGDWCCFFNKVAGTA